MPVKGDPANFWCSDACQEILAFLLAFADETAAVSAIGWLQMSSFAEQIQVVNIQIRSQSSRIVSLAL